MPINPDDHVCFAHHEGTTYPAQKAQIIHQEIALFISQDSYDAIMACRDSAENHPRFQLKFSDDDHFLGYFLKCAIKGMVKTFEIEKEDNCWVSISASTTCAGAGVCLNPVEGVYSESVQ